MEEGEQAEEEEEGEEEKEVALRAAGKAQECLGNSKKLWRKRKVKKGEIEILLERHKTTIAMVNETRNW